MLNAEYPAESSNVWVFIQKGFYKLSTKFDKIYTTVNSFKNELGLDASYPCNCTAGYRPLISLNLRHPHAILRPLVKKVKKIAFGILYTMTSFFF